MRGFRTLEEAVRDEEIEKRARAVALGLPVTGDGVSVNLSVHSPSRVRQRYDTYRLSSAFAAPVWRAKEPDSLDDRLRRSLQCGAGYASLLFFPAREHDRISLLGSNVPLRTLHGFIGTADLSCLGSNVRFVRFGPQYKAFVFGCNVTERGMSAREFLREVAHEYERYRNGVAHGATLGSVVDCRNSSFDSATPLAVLDSSLCDSIDTALFAGESISVPSCVPEEDEWCECEPIGAEDVGFIVSSDLTLVCLPPSLAATVVGGVVYGGGSTFSAFAITGTAQLKFSKADYLSAGHPAILTRRLSGDLACNWLALRLDVACAGSVRAGASLGEFYNYFPKFASQCDAVEVEPCARSCVLDSGGEVLLKTDFGEGPNFTVISVCADGERVDVELGDMRFTRPLKIIVHGSFPFRLCVKRGKVYIHPAVQYDAGLRDGGKANYRFAALANELPEGYHPPSLVMAVDKTLSEFGEDVQDDLLDFVYDFAACGNFSQAVVEFGRAGGGFRGFVGD